MKLFKHSRGDTIVEVLLSITALSLILSASYVLANRSSKSIQQSQERSEALKIAETQIESLKAYLANPGSPIPVDAFCMNGAATVEGAGFQYSSIPGNASADPLTAYPTTCRVGTSNRFNTVIAKQDATTYIAMVRWNRVNGQGVDQAVTYYRLYATTTADVEGTPAPPTAPNTSIVSGPPTTTVAASANFVFASTGGAGTTFECSVDGAAFTPCTSPRNYGGMAFGAHTFTVRSTDIYRNTDPTPATWNWTRTRPVVQATISPTTGVYKSKHLYFSNSESKTFTVSLPASSGSSLLGTATLSGTGRNAYSIGTDNCSGRTIAAGGTCTITVRFAPAIGATQDRLANAGNKTATLTISQSEAGMAAMTVDLSGKAMSSSLTPGDIMRYGDNLYSWQNSASCYNDVESCSNVLTIRSDGYLVLYNYNYTRQIWYLGTGQPGSYFHMQTNGNLVLYGPSGNVQYQTASYTAPTANDWATVLGPTGGSGMAMRHNYPTLSAFFYNLYLEP